MWGGGAAAFLERREQRRYTAAVRWRKLIDGELGGRRSRFEGWYWL